MKPFTKDKTTTSIKRESDGVVFEVDQRVSFIDPQSGIYTDGIVIGIHGPEEIEVGYWRSSWSDTKYNRLVSVDTLLRCGKVSGSMKRKSTAAAAAPSPTPADTAKSANSTTSVNRASASAEIASGSTTGTVSFTSTSTNSKASTAEVTSPKRDIENNVTAFSVKKDANTPTPADEADSTTPGADAAPSSAQVTSVKGLSSFGAPNEESLAPTKECSSVPDSVPECRSTTAISPAFASLPQKGGTDPTTVTSSKAIAASVPIIKDFHVRTSARVSACPLCIGCGTRGPPLTARSTISKEWTCQACLEHVNSCSPNSSLAPVSMKDPLAPAGPGKVKKRDRETESGRSKQRGEKKQGKAFPDTNSVYTRDMGKNDGERETKSAEEDHFEAEGLAPSIQAALGISRSFPPLQAPATSADASGSSTSGPGITQECTSSLFPLASKAPTPTSELAAGAEVANYSASVRPHTVPLQQQQQSLDPSSLEANFLLNPLEGGESHPLYAWMPSGLSAEERNLQIQKGKKDMWGTAVALVRLREEVERCFQTMDGEEGLHLAVARHKQQQHHLAQPLPLQSVTSQSSFMPHGSMHGSYLHRHPQQQQQQQLQLQQRLLNGRVPISHHLACQSTSSPIAGLHFPNSHLTSPDPAPSITEPRHHFGQGLPYQPPPLSLSSLCAPPQSYVQGHDSFCHQQGQQPLHVNHQQHPPQTRHMYAYPRYQEKQQQQKQQQQQQQQQQQMMYQYR